MTDWIVPKFIYTPVATPITFTPTYPPNAKQPVDAMAAIRHDSITSSGKKQSVTERVDNLNSLQFKTVPESDLSGWVSFLSFALSGGAFDYYPNAASSTHTSYTLEDVDWDPKWQYRQTYSFNLKMRKVV